MSEVDSLGSLSRSLIHASRSAAEYSGNRSNLRNLGPPPLVAFFASVLAVIGIPLASRYRAASQRRSSLFSINLLHPSMCSTQSAWLTRNGNRGVNLQGQVELPRQWEDCMRYLQKLSHNSLCFMPRYTGACVQMLKAIHPPIFFRCRGPAWLWR